jgi:TonB-linked SusC/RagA family outer membrane protein
MKNISIAIALLVAQPALLSAQTAADSSAVASPASRNFSGRILSTDGTPIEGVIVSVPGRGVSTTTDADGRYSISTKATQGTLKVVSADYYGHEYPLDQNVIPSVIVLVPNTERHYSGTVITPNGTQDRDAASAIVETLYKKDMKASNSADLAWQDGVAGLQVSRKSGMPGEGGYYNIRGLHTLHADNTPLIVINGVPFLTNTTVSDVINGYSRDALFGYNANDIRSISVLKGADAAMYGSLGSNGVILIETEQANSDNLDTKISFTGNYGVNIRQDAIPTLGASDFRSYMMSLGQSRYSSLSELQTDYPFLKSGTNYYSYLFNNNTDWVDLIGRNSFVTDNVVRVEGGDEVAKYNISFGYSSEAGTLENTRSDRYHTSINSNIMVSRQVDIFTSVNLAYLTSDLNETGMSEETNPILAAYHAMPNLSPYEKLADGGIISRYAKYNAWNTNSNPTYAYDNVSNPLAIVNTVEATDKVYDANIRLGVNWRPTTQWTFTGLVNLYYNYTEEYLFTPGVTDQAILPQLYGTGENYVSMGVIRQSAYYFNFNAAYKNVWNDVHALDAYAGVRFLTRDYEYDVSSGYNTANDYYQTLSKTSDEWNILGDNEEWRLLSYYLHGDYTYNHLLKASAGLSVDGTSVSGVDATRFGFFPSASLTYMAANSEWMPDVVDRLNVTGEVSLSGNSRFSSNYAKNYYTSNNLFNMGTIVRAGLPNTKLEWEKKLQYDLGFDLGLLKNRINLRVNAFYADAFDLLLDRDISAVFGSSEPYYDNTAEIATRGLEAGVRFNPIHNRTWDWVVSGDAAWSRSRVKDLGAQSQYIQTYTAYNGDDAQTRLMVDRAPYEFYGLQTAGVYSTTAEALSPDANGHVLVNTYGNNYQGGDVIFVDQNNDGIINDDDRVALGTAAPDVYGSFGTSLRYKQWTLSADFGYSFGNKAYNATRRETESMDKFYNQSTSILNRWQVEGQQTSMPRAAYGDPSGNNFFSDRWIEDASFVKLRNLQLSYAFDKSLLKFCSGSIYVAAENLFTWTDYLGGDPEFSYSYAEALRGFDYAKVTSPTTVKVGVQLNF